MAVRVKTKSASKRPLAVRLFIRLLKAVGYAFALSIVCVVLLRWIPPLTSGVMMERRVEALLAWKSYPSITAGCRGAASRNTRGVAVIAAEDQNFPTHHGFDVESIQKAIDAAEKGRRLRGASTISQQVAKNVFLWSGRSFVRKGLEAYFTVLIELTWSKRRILEVYLNIAELGRRRVRRRGGQPAVLQEAGRETRAVRSGPACRRAAEPDPLPRRPPVCATSKSAAPGSSQQMDQLGGTALFNGW